MSGATGLAVVRALAQSGIRVIAVHHERSAAMHTALASPRIIPDWRSAPERLVPALIDMARALPAPSVPTGATHSRERATGPPIAGRASLFVCDDAALPAVEERADDLRAVGLQPAFASSRPIARLIDKRTQYQAARTCGVPVPWSCWGPASQVLAERPGCPFPAIVKPAVSHAGIAKLGAKGIRCQDESGLEEALKRAGDTQVIVQELIPGSDDELYTVGLFLSEARELVFGGRKLRQHPAGIGIASLAETANLPADVVEGAIRLLRTLGYLGVAQVEYKRDPRTGDCKLIEANLRPWTWIGLATASGVNLPLAAHRWALWGKEANDGNQPQTGCMAQAKPRPRRWVWSTALATDLARDRQVRPDLWRDTCCDAFFSRRDPRPFLVSLLPRRIIHAAPKTRDTGRRPALLGCVKRLLVLPAAPLSAVTIWALWLTRTIRQPIAIGPPAARPLLVLAPHPDDETIMGGATIARVAATGAVVHVVAITSGEATRHGSVDEAGIGDVRLAELTDAAAQLGVRRVESWSLGDGSLDVQRPQLTDFIVTAIVSYGPQIVMAPFPFDVHPDHVALSLALADALRRLRAIGAETPGVLCAPALTPLDPAWVNRLVPAGDLWPRKLAAITAYSSRGTQLFAKPLLLARLHPCSWLRPAEAFVELNGDQHVELVDALAAEGLVHSRPVSHAHPVTAPMDLLGEWRVRRRIGEVLAGVVGTHARQRGSESHGLP